MIFQTPTQQRAPVEASLPLQVAVVFGETYLGGAELSLIDVLRHLPGGRCRIQAIVLGDADTPVERALRRSSLPVTVLPFSRGRHLPSVIATVAKLAALSRHMALLHAADLRAAVICQAASLINRRRWVWTVQDLVRGSHRYERVIRWARPDRIIAISTAVKRSLADYGSWRNDQIEIVRHGINLDAFSAGASSSSWRDEMKLADDEIAIGIVGRLLPWKGQEDFLRAAALVAPRFQRARFFVVGDQLTDPFTTRKVGDERRRLESLAATLGIAGRVAFTGMRQDIPDVMAGLDVFVLASYAEPLGRVLLEAMASGTAVLATDAGAAREVVGDSGILFPPRDYMALASALSSLMASPTRIKELGARARARMLAWDTVEHEASKICAVWEIVACGRRSASSNRPDS